MLPFDQLTARGRVRRLRRVAENALAHYELDVVRHDGFVVTLPEMLESEDLVQVSFRSTIYRNQTRFNLFLGNTSLGDVRQRVDAGDASDIVSSETVSVSLPQTADLLANVSLSTSVLTPNDDGVHDRLDMEFDLLKLLTPRPVTALVYDLSGRALRSLELADAVAGRYLISWDGNDDSGARVAPGTYLLRISVEGDSRTEEYSRLLAVAY
ncbi:MAG TPA: FlgD immunoglobulin-like domain containing protein [Candidatus Latescibacteria bacterium]|jgi:hypothetical protein|nr:FlgD immunoglobulin-like domain containing protein [Candidatus Latescibacterota bacterium]HJP31708.1 FlgD immunoglobulin-like domain containing protein [Candidatus Latescibacterota bacterium]